MDNLINIVNKQKATRSLNSYAERDHGHIDVRFRNVHLCLLNETIGRTIFRKNDLYADASTLYELMMPIGGRGSHHYHGLKPTQIIQTLSNLKKADCIIHSEKERILLGVYLETGIDKCMVVIIDPEATVKTDFQAKVCKLITMYEYSEFSKHLKNIPKEDIILLRYPIKKGDT